MAEQQEYWFAARTRKDQELAVRNSLKKIGVKHFLPTQLVTRQLKYRKRQVEVPLIRNLIFVYTTKEHACAIANDYRVPLFYLRDLSTHKILVVPNKQMHDFMFVMDLAPTSVSFDEEEMLIIGTKVQVVKGNFSGIEGELAQIASRTYVLIRIQGVLSATIKVPKSYLRILS